ncbi:hypothetical protein GMAR_ORF272 [Golden Marseillevirus]|uniref:hypothetical protein n=1 Tax=Golden Marseillevirus TaxID=1720526 RepID=UPI000877A9CA|nr:hypothetical protein GMAR_ORF272 [Golden Marseillevirus]ALX27646.1 hypothetical protein GMAR_ORF272 [Golden Marseillevirus]
MMARSLHQNWAKLKYPDISAGKPEKFVATYTLSPLGLAEGKISLKGKFGTKCEWSVKKGMLHGPYKTETVDCCDISHESWGNFRRGKLHGKEVFETCTPRERKEITWYRGQKLKKQDVSENAMTVKVYKTARKRKSREKVRLSESHYLRSSSFAVMCGEKEAVPWARRTVQKINGKTSSVYSQSWFDGISFVCVEDNKKVVVNREFPGDWSFISDCCPRHSEFYDKVKKGEVKICPRGITG